MAEKPTTMVLHVVDLQCSKCFKKIKELLCKFPEIRDQTYDEKANKVTIKVVSCSPEKIKDKLYCKGGGCIKKIEIKEPEPPKPKPVEPKPPEPKPQPKKISVDMELCLKLQRPCSCGKRPCSCDKHACSCGESPCSCGQRPSSCGQRPSSCGQRPCSCGGRPCSCGRRPCSCRESPCSCGRRPCASGGDPCTCGRWPCSCGWRPCSCGGQGQCDQCYGKPVCDSWSGYGSGCVYYTEENPQGCSIM